MELVGLGYSIWFTTRYLLFKRNRDELASKIEEVKQQVLGSKN
ncbi:putative cyanobacterial aminoacyl-tRNA synthetase, CAAD domain, protein CURVATURE THYLAKOID 1 [Helianthus annuus]|nr:putative cyanobacterial aminoacyl-tRNA synthetase, CAAD domain, protein CURVATURE THYLAKOID 1 [Helianthus annuus]KAJ0485789.1 putative cyanobacterial aminoacyl-tRNA synthetase, CAAD domain, protein CURVATURE THYLAKOID 1 [Helianthus annuus]KAJ0656341.1 putative cyanobacterial aminoacyl-tRNA synthetase, CAAD domain, protein CURVATURE THYLAKOID 1 [Helianthus annuus]KAJ0659978.1 putative cyanobacterial aminoacyl-tRNA synthetase, CAAD domain, protein CURVATURE THYLAKOID 1 [Helianthus annuus]KAJ08